MEVEVHLTISCLTKTGKGNNPACINLYRRFLFRRVTSRTSRWLSRRGDSPSFGFVPGWLAITVFAPVGGCSPEGERNGDAEGATVWPGVFRVRCCGSINGGRPFLWHLVRCLASFAGPSHANGGPGNLKVARSALIAKIYFALFAANFG